MDRKRRQIYTLIITAAVVVLCIIIIIASIAIKNHIESEIGGSITGGAEGGGTNQPSNEPTPPDANEITEAKFIDLQPTIDTWVKTLNRDERAGVMIYDLTNSRTAASYHADEVFDVASVYKLLFTYDGYRQIALGADDPNSFYTRTEDKGNLTLSKCLDLMIRESYNGCADKMLSDQYRASRVNDLIRSVGMTNTSNHGLTSTAADLTKLLRTYWRHTDLNQDLWGQITDSMLNQPPSHNENGELYNWRQGLPAGFGKNVNVYNKVGWEWNGSRWNIYADAAIVDFTEFKHYYTVVVLTSNLSSYNKITRLGQMIEDTVITESEGIIK